jgi:EpsI family protein
MNKKLQWVAFVLMALASVIAVTLTPTHKISLDRKVKGIDLILPVSFSDWHVSKSNGGYVINPVAQENVNSIYTQTITRTYENGNGEIIMLTIAYGDEQSDTKRLHYPEACYPAQGFKIVSSTFSSIETAFGDIPVKHVYATLGLRSEPITYWSTVGNRVVLGEKQSKLEQLKYGFNGQIPDGLLFRVSSIAKDPNDGYAIQRKFVNDLINALSADARERLAGLKKAGT